MKALSKRYLDKLSFGEVRHTDELSQSFGITEYPTLMAVTDGENMQGDVYEGEMKVD